MPDNSSRLYGEEAELKAAWNSVLEHLEGDLGNIWTEQVKKDFERINEITSKLDLLIKALYSHYYKQDKKKLEEMAGDVAKLRSHLKKIKAKQRWLDLIHSDIQTIIEKIESAEPKKGLPSSFQGLIEKAQRTGGFIYYSTDSTKRMKGYQLLDQKGFFRGDSNIVGYRCHGYIGLDSDISGGKRGFNEAVIYRRTTINKQVGEKKVHWYSSEKEPIYENIPVKTEDIIEGGGQEPAFSLSYYVKRVEEDTGSRTNQYIQQTLVASEELIESLIAEIKKDPSKASLIFKGVFPELEKRFHGKPNGRILIAREKDVTPPYEWTVEQTEEKKKYYKWLDEDIPKFVHNY